MIVAAACQSSADTASSSSPLVTPDIEPQGPELAAQGPAPTSEQATTRTRAQTQRRAHSPLLSTNDAGHIEAACSQRCVALYDNCSWRAQVACIDRCVMTGASVASRGAGPSAVDVAGIPWAMGDAHIFDTELDELGNCPRASMW